MSQAVATPTTSAFDKIIGRSPLMQQVVEQARRAAASDATVLIQGESGTGKELVAEAIHRSSIRRAKPFVTINMAAVPDTLIESELFGHAAGAFTGAGTSRTGRFEAADSGTIFIDEIGDLKLSSQAKLLRVLETHSVTPVGSNDNRHIDVRVLAATNRDLSRMISEGDFREDLYYRLNVVTVMIPPLRKRRSDIPTLVHYYLDRLCRANDRPRPDIDDGLMQVLIDFGWPGNIRQLRNCIESMVVLSAKERLTVDDLPEIVRDRDEPRQDVWLDIPDHFTLEDVERAVLMQKLEACDGNRTQTARSLGISVRTLQRRLKQWRINGKGRPAAARLPQTSA